MKPLVTVLVCAYNDENTMGTVLQGITRLTYEPLEIIVINDASTDRTAEIIGQFPVTPVHNPVNRGLGYNLNFGLQTAQGEYLAVVQSDCEIVDPDWLDQMMEPMADEKVGVVVSQREITGFAALPAGARLFNAVAPQDLHNSTGQPMELEYCRGKADLYRVSLLRELNGWNRSFFTAGEDTDLSIRIRERGVRILLHPKATIRYLFSGRQASVGGSLKKAFLYGKTAFLLYHLHGYDGIQARTYMVILLAAFVLPLPVYAQLVAGTALFFYSLKCRIQTMRDFKVPFALLALVASIPLTVINFRTKFGFQMLPAASLVLAGIAYTGYLAAKNTIRNLPKGEKITRLPGTYLFCLAWRMVSGIGYLAGAFDYCKRNLGKQRVLNENPVD